jgi:5-formyltetrahydrofolate cyclo-ligase
MADSAEAKATLRRAMRARRAAMAPLGEAAALAAARLLPVEQLPRFQIVSAYMPKGAEFDPWPVVERLTAAGARVALPRAEDRAAGMSFRLSPGRDHLVPDAFGVPSPPAGAPEACPDLVICPLLAFDRRGRRLGQGGGHFDRALTALKATQPVFVLGVGYACQEAQTIPAEPHDVLMDAILTETAYIVVR